MDAETPNNSNTQNGASQQVVAMKSLLEAGVHFGHRTRRWNPKMKPFIFTERNGIHIIDLQQTITRLNQAYDIVKQTVVQGGTVLFVGTKKQAQESIVQEANRCAMPFVENRWLGGTLTNWRTIRQRIDHLQDIERQQARGEFARLVKKEALMREREIERLNRRLQGLKEMRRLPNVLFITDTRRDDLAVKEANTLGIPIIAMVDTNCDPDPIDFVIPSNDDAIRAIKLIVGTIANAVIEGRHIYNSFQDEQEQVSSLDTSAAQELFLGPSTLAKLQEAPEEDGQAPDDTAMAQIAEAAGLAAQRGEKASAAITEVAPTAESVAEDAAATQTIEAVESAEASDESEADIVDAIAAASTIFDAAEAETSSDVETVAPATDDNQA